VVLTYLKGYAKLEFPATCPLCDHAPLEADSCTVNKSLRNTMRVWLQKQKKKGESKSAPQIAMPPVEPTPPATEGEQAADSADKPVTSVEGGPKTEDPVDQPPAPAEGGEDAGRPPLSAVSASNEVSGYKRPRLSLQPLTCKGLYDSPR
jgi:hypothetical protein